jgi:hypothetical protein
MSGITESQTYAPLSSLSVTLFYNDTVTQDNFAKVNCKYRISTVDWLMCFVLWIECSLPWWMWGLLLLFFYMMPQLQVLLTTVKTRLNWFVLLYSECWKFHLILVILLCFVFFNVQWFPHVNRLAPKATIALVGTHKDQKTVPFQSNSVVITDQGSDKINRCAFCDFCSLFVLFVLNRSTVCKSNWSTVLWNRIA